MCLYKLSYLFIISFILTLHFSSDATLTSLSFSKSHPVHYAIRSNDDDYGGFSCIFYAFYLYCVLFFHLLQVKFFFVELVKLVKLVKAVAKKVKIGSW